MTNIILSGPDGTGKTTLMHEINKNSEFDEIWLRFNHFTAKVVNFFGRVLGKSYRVKHSWGEIGYHDYTGVFGSLYIYAVFLDFIMFDTFFKLKVFLHRKPFLIDRYIIDIVADLIVDTQNSELVFKLFDSKVKRFLKTYNIFLLQCGVNEVYSRRPDIKDDAKYLLKIETYESIKQRFNIPMFETDKLKPKEIALEVLSAVR